VHASSADLPQDDLVLSHIKDDAPVWLHQDQCD
jgi:hypothetical protein